MSDLAELASFFGFTANVSVGDFVIPNPVLLDDDQQERWEALQLLLESCDTDADGEPLQPYRIDGEPLTPPYNVQLAKAVFGDDYESAKAAGVSGNRVSLEWARMNKEIHDKRQEGN